MREITCCRRALRYQAAEALSARIGTLECVIARKVGETKTLYGSVTAADLGEYLKTQQIEIDRRKIQLGDPLKELGESKVPIKLHLDVTAQLKVRIVSEQTDDEASSDPLS